MEKPTLTPEEEKIAYEIYRRISGLKAERKKEILQYVTIVFKEDLSATIRSLTLEAERLSKI